MSSALVRINTRTEKKLVLIDLDTGVHTEKYATSVNGYYEWSQPYITYPGLIHCNGTTVKLFDSEGNLVREHVPSFYTEAGNYSMAAVSRDLTRVYICGWREDDNWAGSRYIEIVNMLTGTYQTVDISSTGYIFSPDEMVEVDGKLYYMLTDTDWTFTKFCIADSGIPDPADAAGVPVTEWDYSGQPYWFNYMGTTIEINNQKFLSITVSGTPSSNHGMFALLDSYPAWDDLNSSFTLVNMFASTTVRNNYMVNGGSTSSVTGYSDLTGMWYTSNNSKAMTVETAIVYQSPALTGPFTTLDTMRGCITPLVTTDGKYIYGAVYSSKNPQVVSGSVFPFYHMYLRVCDLETGDLVRNIYLSPSDLPTFAYVVALNPDAAGPTGPEIIGIDKRSGEYGVVGYAPDAASVPAPQPPFSGQSNGGGTGGGDGGRITVVFVGDDGISHVVSYPANTPAGSVVYSSDGAQFIVP